MGLLDTRPATAAARGSEVRTPPTARCPVDGRKEDTSLHGAQTRNRSGPPDRRLEDRDGQGTPGVWLRSSSYLGR